MSAKTKHSCILHPGHEVQSTQQAINKGRQEMKTAVIYTKRGVGSTEKIAIIQYETALT
jgi:hypothetical protein